MNSIQPDAFEKFNKGFQDEPSSFSQHSLMLSALLRQISHERERRSTCVFVPQFDGIELLAAPRWSAIFQQAFLVKTWNDSGIGPRDDLLFFVPKRSNSRSKSVEIKVYRQNSSKLPEITDPTVDWEETVYLNLLMQYFVYTVTVAVCTRTGPQELQILKKFSETVYASPNRRQMDGKGQTDEVVYPNLFFSVDNYDEAFSGCVVHDSECVCVELTAYDLSGQMRGVCFLGTIQYDSLKKFYDSKSTPAQRPERVGLLGRQFGSMSNRGTLCTLNSPLSSGLHPAPVKFMRMLGPQAKGLAEFAVCAVDTPEDQMLGFCRCGGERRSRLFGSGCCTCGSTGSLGLQMLDDPVVGTDLATSDRTKVEFQIGSPITRQPGKFTSSGLSDWFDSNGTDSERKTVMGMAKTTVPDIAPLHTIPSSAKSAGASAETSPVRRWPRRFREASLSSQEEETAGHSARFRTMFSNENLRFERPRRSSKVSDILDRFTRAGTANRKGQTHSESLNTVDSSADRVAPDENAAGQNERFNCTSRFNSIDEENDEANDGCLYPNRDAHRQSFGQAWSWFKERRRLTSVGLNVSLTFLNIPSDGILMDLLESKREPILNIAD